MVAAASWLSSAWTPIDGGITAPTGFQASGITAGLKDSGKPDLALMLAPQGAVCAGTFTTSEVRAACVDLCAIHLVLYFVIRQTLLLLLAFHLMH